MHRRLFIKDTGLTAIGISVFDKIGWKNDRFTGDVPTTTDILGPFYRPGAPDRKNIISKGYLGPIFNLSGTVFKDDGKTPFKNCLVEIWQCDENMLYDNTSDEFRYRGSQRTADNGKYHFIAMRPIPYPAGENSETWRPAHIHMLISGEGQQDLITQIYLEGDPYLEKDLASASPDAIKRILRITSNSRNEESVRFDIVMAREFKPDNTVFEKLTGVYAMNDKSVMEFYKKNDFLFLKNGTA